MAADLKKILTFWLASFLVVGIVLFFYFGVSLGSILIAGFVTFCITYGRYWISSKKI